MDKEKIIKWMELCDTKGIGSGKIIKLLSIFKDIKNIYSATDSDLLKTRIFNEDMINQFNKLKKENYNYFKYIIEECERKKIKIIPFYSEEYPMKLKTITDAPLILFALGDIKCLKSKKIAVVGSRESSEEAKKWAFDNSQKIAKRNITIVSGGAKGIDYESHKGALSVDGKTICVVGSGLLRLYPKENNDLFEEIKNKGLILSENPPDYQGGRISLLRRNRIISGISDGLIIVTSATHGGSIVQLKLAYAQRVPIFCPSFSLGLSPNKGIEEAIKNYRAREITTIEPIIKEINQPDIFSFK